VKEFSPAPIEAAAAKSGDAQGQIALRVDDRKDREALPAGAKVAALEVTPKEIKFGRRYEYAQVIVSAKLETGETIDVTRMADAKVTGPGVEISPAGLIQPKADGEAKIVFSLAGQSTAATVAISGMKEEFQADFIRDVAQASFPEQDTRGECDVVEAHHTPSGPPSSQRLPRAYSASTSRPLSPGMSRFTV
jgi:hypothetical protein